MRIPMYAIEEPSNVEPREFYRCAVPKELQSAKVTWGLNSSINVRVTEKSINGCTMLVKKRDALKLRGKKGITLKFDGTKAEICELKASDSSEKGYVQVGATISKDTTPPEKVKTSWWPSRSKSNDNAQIVFAGFVLVLFCAMAMPGLGDKLGTADRIQNAFYWLVNSADNSISGY